MDDIISIKYHNLEFEKVMVQCEYRDKYYDRYIPNTKSIELNEVDIIQFIRDSKLNQVISN